MDLAEIAWVIGVVVASFGVSYWSIGFYPKKVATGVRIGVSAVAGLLAGFLFFIEMY